MTRWTTPLAAALAVALPFTPATAGGDGPCAAPRAAAAAEQDIVATAAAAGQFETLLAAAKAADLAGTLQGPGPFTVFAPTDAAFAKLPAGTVEGLLKDKAALAAILSYHVVPGRILAKDVKTGWAETAQGQSLRVEVRDGNVTVDGAKVVAADVLATNGVIHVIDSVVLPRKDLVDTALAAGSFGTLAKALEAAGLVETLRGKGPFTVFAPTDAAFARLPAGALDGLLQDRSKLTSVLTYHVVPGRVLSTDLDASRGDVTTKVKTAQGAELTVTKTRDGRVTVNGVQVVTRDVLAGNGVIHVIDAVVLPNDPS